MKHTWKITLVLLGMFLITQFIGLAVINSYIGKQLPYGMQPPEMAPQVSITSIIISFAIAILLIFLLMKIKATIFLRLWFFVVVLIALAITFNSLFASIPYASYISLIIALPLSFYKIFRRNLVVHNLTELLIYPGIAAVFVPILNLWAIILLLLLISIYDIYAVWHSGFMQKMAQFQINQLKLFAGFFIPYASKEAREKINLLKQKYKEKALEKKLKKAKIKVNLAILGGGDVVFPIIFAGVVFSVLGLFPAIIVSLFATLALFILQIFARKNKFYPAMPFLTAGCLLGLLIGYLVHIL